MEEPPKQITHVSQACSMKLSTCIITISALIWPLSSFASEGLFVLVPAALHPSAPIPAAVRSECGTEMLVANYALAAIGRHGGNVQSVAKPEQAGAEKVVQLTILSIHGFGGGAWSGAKSMTVRVDLRKGSTSLGSTVLQRSSRGGALGGMSGTCAILDRVAGALGKDVARWVSSPMQLRTTEAAVEAAGEAADAAEPPASAAGK